MAVGKRVAAAAVMVVGREVSPKLSGEGVQHEATVIDAVRVFIGKNPELGRGGIDNVREGVVFAPAPAVDAGVVHVHRRIVETAFNEAVHRDTTDARQLYFSDLRGVRVGWALVDAGRLGVWAELGIKVAHHFFGTDQVEGVGVVAVVWAKIEEAVDPAAGILNMLGVGRQLVLVVADVQLPCREQLPLIVQAIDAGGIALGLGQGRQQQAGEDRDDGDHDQQLDQREALGQALG